MPVAPEDMQAPAFVDSLVHGLYYVQKSYNLGRQVSGGHEGANMAGYVNSIFW